MSPASATIALESRASAVLSASRVSSLVSSVAVVVVPVVSIVLIGLLVIPT